MNELIHSSQTEIYFFSVQLLLRIPVFELKIYLYFIELLIIRLEIEFIKFLNHYNQNKWLYLFNNKCDSQISITSKVTQSKIVEHSRTIDYYHYQ